MARVYCRIARYVVVGEDLHHRMDRQLSQGLVGFGCVIDVLRSDAQGIFETHRDGKYWVSIVLFVRARLIG